MKHGEQFKPTDEHRRMVEELASCGITQENIAKILRISGPTLRKYFRFEIECAAEKANAQVAQTLFAKATSRDLNSASVQAAMFWLRCRGGWRTTDPAEEKEKLGKKEQQKIVAATSEKGTDWDRLLNLQ